MTQNTMTPPEHLVAQMIEQAFGPLGPAGLGNSEQLLKAFVVFAGAAAQWGADQELEACLDAMNEWGDIHNSYGGELADDLHADRRPKPPTLKQRAQKNLADMIKNGHLSPDLAELFTAAVEMAPDE